MPRFATVSRERHGQKKWLRCNDYGFAAADGAAPIVGLELARAALSVPCGFLEQSGCYTLVALLAPVPGRNMFVGPGGRWLGPYVPAWFRAYPFRMLPQQGTDKLALGVDEDSKLVAERSAAGGEDFFDAEGNFSPALRSVFESLAAVERNRKATDLAVAALAQAGVIRPWPITLKTEQGEQVVTGLHRVDEAALRALPDDLFLKLRKTAALPIAYAQMLSAGQLGVFEQLARLHDQPAPSPLAALPETLDHLLEKLNDDMIRFD
jgi:SapC